MTAMRWFPALWTILSLPAGSLARADEVKVEVVGVVKTADGKPANGAGVGAREAMSGGRRGR